MAMFGEKRAKGKEVREEGKERKRSGLAPAQILQPSLKTPTAFLAKVIIPAKLPFP
jgi:hypothetical protein